MLTFIPEIESILNIRVEKNNNLIITYRDGRVETHTWKDRSRAESWTPEMKEKARERAKRQHAAHTTD